MRERIVMPYGPLQQLSFLSVPLKEDEEVMRHKEPRPA